MAKKPKSDKTPPKADGDTRSTVGELTDDQKQALYFQRKRRIVSLRDKIATTTAELRNEYRGLKAELGITKADVDYALRLDGDDDGKIIEEHRRRMMLARWEQHPIGAQSDMFAEVDLTPADDIAFGAGKKAGLAGDPCVPGYDPSTSQYRRYMDGFHEGQAVLAKGIKPVAGDVPEGSRPKGNPFSSVVGTGEALIHGKIGDAKPTAEVH